LKSPGCWAEQIAATDNSATASPSFFIFTSSLGRRRPGRKDLYAFELTFNATDDATTSGALPSWLQDRAAHPSPLVVPLGEGIVLSAYGLQQALTASFFRLEVL
jgi:hypothetical protein